VSTVPLSAVPIDVRKEYALALLNMNMLDGWEALRVTVAPDDFGEIPSELIPELTAVTRRLADSQPRERPCATCGEPCWSRHEEARCRKCYAKTRRAVRGFCAKGHPWTPENVYTRPNGWQYCRPCMNESKREHRERYGRRDRA
jgi:hypothetical protein